MFAAVFTLTTTNFTLIGYYLHYVNSSLLNNAVTKQKAEMLEVVDPLQGSLVNFRLNACLGDRSFLLMDVT